MRDYQELDRLLNQNEDAIIQSLAEGSYKAEELFQLQERETFRQNRARVLAAIVQLKRDITG